ncbi:MAG: cytochrome c [Acidobacteria bacterium]|nr:cytochrome c [Acidobacteriota bacterium]
MTGRHAAPSTACTWLAMTVMAMLSAAIPLEAQQPVVATDHPQTFGLGRAATASEIAALDIDVMPDGTGLPPGAGSASDGARVWARACAGCHGREGEGSTAAPVVGPDLSDPRPTVGNYWPYATTLYDYINRAMPRNAPGTLTPDDVYGLVAWILSKNDIISPEAVMNASTLPGVNMPARPRFITDDRRGGPEVR